MLPNRPRLWSTISADLPERLAVLFAIVPLVCLIVFVSEHLVNIPWGESWPIAETHVIPAYDHTLPISALMEQFRDHRPVTYYMVFLLDLFVTRWDLRVYPFIVIFQAAIWTMLLGMLVWHQNRQAFSIAIVPMSCLVFAINLSAVWIRGYFDQLFHPLFFTAALYVITRQPQGWRPLIFSCLFAILAFYSTLVGVTALLVLPLALWQKGYRRVWHYGLCFAIFLICVLFYFIGWQKSDLTQPLSGPILAIVWGVIRFALATLGSVFTKTAWLAALLPIAGSLIAAVNIYQLRNRPDFWQLMTPWLGMLAYGLLAAFFVGIGRMGYAYSKPDARDYMMTKPHYSLIGNVFWLAVIALGGLVVVSIRGKKWLVYTNVAILTIFAILYCQNNYNAATTYQLPDSPYGPTPENETCVRLYPISGNSKCFFPNNNFWFGAQYAPLAYELAERRLATFAQSDNVQVEMPSEYENGDVIIVDGRLAAQHVPLVTSDGAQVPESSIIRLLDPSQVPLYSGQTDRLIVGADPAQQKAFINSISGAHRVWYLGALITTTFGNSLLTSLNSQFVREKPNLSPKIYKTTRLYVPASVSYSAGQSEVDLK